MTRKRLDVEAEHKKMRGQFTAPGASNSMTDAQGFGTWKGDARGRIRDVGAHSGPPAKPHSTPVQKLIGKLPGGSGGNPGAASPYGLSAKGTVQKPVGKVGVAAKPASRSVKSLIGSYK